MVVATVLTLVLALLPTRATLAGPELWTSHLAVSTALLPLAVDPVDSLAVYAGTSTNLYKTLDGGVAWGIVGNLPAGSPIFSLALDGSGNAIYAGSQGVADVFRSPDGGLSWYVLFFGGSLGAYPRTLAVDPSSAAIVYAGLARDGSPGGSLLKSIDSGQTWTAVVAGLPSPGGVPAVFAIAIDPQSPSTLYAGLDRAGVSKSVNGGIRWEATGFGSICSACTVHALSIDPTATTTLYAAASAGIFKTTNGGGTWREINTGLRGPGGAAREMRAVVIDPTRPEVIYAGSPLAGVYRSLDGGATWVSWSEGLSDTRILSLAIDRTGTQLHAGTPSGVFDRSVPAERLVIRSPRNRPPPRRIEPRP